MIYEILLEGAENAQTGRTICNMLNITARDLTIAVERERREGKPICASTGANPGYYIPEYREEMAAFCRSLNRRAGEIQKTRRACLKTLDGLPEREGAADA